MKCMVGIVSICALQEVTMSQGIGLSAQNSPLLYRPLTVIIYANLVMAEIARSLKKLKDWRVSYDFQI